LESIKFQTRKTEKAIWTEYDPTNIFGTPKEIGIFKLGRGSFRTKSLKHPWAVFQTNDPH